MKRIMVDMSATLIHHGHIRLLRKCREIADEVVVALTTDEEIKEHKGYNPEIDYHARKEILLGLRYVDRVVPSPWLLTDEFVEKHNATHLVHGSDNSNPVDPSKMVIFPRTKGISSNDLRKNACYNYLQMRNVRTAYTPGPSPLLPESLMNLQPVHGEDDPEYEMIHRQVTSLLKLLTGKDEVVSVQGGETLATEIALTNFVGGKVLLVDSRGNQSELLAKICRQLLESGQIGKLETVSPAELEKKSFGEAERFDWAVAVFVESALGFKNDLEALVKLKNRLGCGLFLDAAGSIGLETGHEHADLISFGSCSGLMGLTGASFIAMERGLKTFPTKSFALDIQNHLSRKHPSPCHAICSLLPNLEKLEGLRKKIASAKQKFTERFSPHLFYEAKFQPLLSTRVKLLFKDSSDCLILKSKDGQTTTLCHLDEIHEDESRIGRSLNRLETK